MSFGPYYADLPVAGGASFAVASATNATLAQLTFGTPHGFISGQPVVFSGGTGAWTAANGTWIVSVLSALVLTIPVNSTSFGALAGALTAAAQPRHYVDPTSWDRRVNESKNWQENVNGGGYTLSNVNIVTGLLGVSDSAPLSFPTIAAGGFEDLSFTVAGAAVGDGVTPSWPDTLEPGLLGVMWVSAANTIKVRLANFTPYPVSPAAAQVFGASAGVGRMPGSSPLTFGSISSGGIGVRTFAMSGALVGNKVISGWPATLEAGLIGLMRVSAADTIEVRLVNLTAYPLTPAPAQIFKATLL